MNLDNFVSRLRPASIAIAISLGASLVGAASAAEPTWNFHSGPLDLAIPDDSDTGMVLTWSSADIGTVASVTVSLDIVAATGSSAWTGDLYAYLRHDSGWAVLLNRPGKSVTSPLGYDDAFGLQIQFSDTAPAGDVHGYRVAATGDANLALSGPLTGLWAPDGRAADPALVTDAAPRTATLSTFTGLSMAGDWSLFVADLSGGSEHRLVGWGIEVAPMAGSGVIPEPASTGWVAGILLIAGTWVMRRARPGRAIPPAS
jgi:subtilisin-like proprotein convertase family protein